MSPHDYLGATLLNSLWQAPLVALTTWIVLRALVKASAATRYAVWLASLLACAVFPVLTTPFDVALRIPVLFMRTAEVIWAVGAAVLLLRVAATALLLSRTKQVAYPLDPQMRGALARWNNRPATFRDVRLCVSRDIDVPVAIGLFDALVLLPEWLASSASAEELDRLASHELAHLRRYDDWTKLIQSVIQALLFFNPAVRWICVQLELEREVACDDAAIQNSGDVETYAICLTRMARAVTWSKRFSLAPSLFAARRTLSLRIERLLAPRAIPPRFSPRVAAGSVATLAAAFLLMRALTPIATSALALPHDDRLVHGRAVALYNDLRTGRYRAAGFARAEAMLSQLGPISDFRVNCIIGDAANPTYLYDVSTSRGHAVMRVHLNAAGGISAFTVTANGVVDRRMIRAFMTTEPSSSAS